MEHRRVFVLFVFSIVVIFRIVVIVGIDTAAVRSVG